MRVLEKKGREIVRLVLYMRVKGKGKVILLEARYG